MDTREPLEFDENAGSYDAWRTFLHGPVSVAGTAEGPASFEDVPWWMQLGVKNAVAATSDAHTTAPAFTRNYVPSAATDDLASTSMQHGVPDNVYESAMVMVPEWTVRGDVDGDASWMFSAALIARSFDHRPAGFTAGVPDREREFIKAAGTKLFIDDTAAGIGATQVLARFINFSVTWNNAIAPKRFMEDENAISARVGRGPRQITGQVRLEFDSNAEKEKYRTGARRSIRIEREGAQIHAVSASPVLPATNKRVRIDIPNARWLTPSDDPRETNMTLTFGFRAYADDVVGYPARVESVSQLATLV